MRIIGGAFRGRRLAAVGKGDAAAHLRPTLDRTRESVFNIIESRYAQALQDAVVLDAFAGTGALGLEALSRGASHVTFIEHGRAALKLLHANIATCGAEAHTHIVARDVRRLGRAGTPANLLFLDPPYGKGLGEEALQVLIKNGWLVPGALVVWEDSVTSMALSSLMPLDERRYGETVVRFFEYKAEK